MAKVGKWFLIALSVVSTVRMLVNVFCQLKFHCQVSNNLLAIATGTNRQEVKEFFSTYFDVPDLIGGLLLLIVSVIAYACIFRSYTNTSRVTSNIALVLFMLSCLVVGRHYDLAWCEYVGVLNKWNLELEEVVDLNSHLKDPQLVEIDSIHPAQVVVIIGESFARSHCSLYDYQKCTNPRMQQRAMAGELIVFDSVYAPAPTTTQVFKYLLGSHTRMLESQGEKWYEGIMLPEVLSKAGYHTYWISNQCEVGLYDNLPSGFSKICHEKYFTPPENYDGLLLDVNVDSVMHCYPKNCFFYHLYGQHPQYDKRYPEGFARFEPGDYDSDYSLEQSILLAHYDNATFYNDWVVDSIIRKFEDTNALILYFSDHGMDIFDTSSDYIGHAKPGNIQSIEYCLKIPFMVYLSPLFQSGNPKVLQQVMDIKDVAFCTDSLYYIIQDLMGYRVHNL